MPAPLVIGLVALGGVGVAAGAKGTRDLVKAKKSIKKSTAKQGKAVQRYESVRDATQSYLKDYGSFQLTIQAETLGAFVKWLEDNQRKVRKLERVSLEGVEVVLPSLPEWRAQVVEAENVLKAGVSAVAAGTAARSAALAGVNAWASASTGTAISTLSGAAAQNAALAYLGGGSIASGGGGMAAGATVLSGVAIAPAVLITGLAIGVQGQKAKTKAAKIEAKVAKSIANMELAAGVLDQLTVRTDELRSVLSRLVARAEISMARLREVDFDPDVHAELFLETAQLIRSVSEVLNTPLLDESGNLTNESIAVIERYRDE